jgi:VanZ family protein
MIRLLRKSPLAIVWAIVVLVLLAVVYWASRQVNDPVSVYIRTDKMQHIIAFGVLGLGALFMPTAAWRLRGLAAIVTLAIVVEWAQIPIQGRTASLSDLLASIVGGFAGFGFGAAAETALTLVRGEVSSPERARVSREP